MTRQVVGGVLRGAGDGVVVAARPPRSTWRPPTRSPRCGRSPCCAGRRSRRPGPAARPCGPRRGRGCRRWRRPATAAAAARRRRAARRTSGPPRDRAQPREQRAIDRPRGAEHLERRQPQSRGLVLDQHLGDPQRRRGRPGRGAARRRVAGHAGVKGARGSAAARGPASRRPWLEQGHRGAVGGDALTVPRFGPGTESSRPRASRPGRARGSSAGGACGPRSRRGWRWPAPGRTARSAARRCRGRRTGPCPGRARGRSP